MLSDIDKDLVNIFTSMLEGYLVDEVDYMQMADSDYSDEVVEACLSERLKDDLISIWGKDFFKGVK